MFDEVSPIKLLKIHEIQYQMWKDILSQMYYKDQHLSGILTQVCIYYCVSVIVTLKSYHTPALPLPQPTSQLT